VGADASMVVAGAASAAVGVSCRVSTGPASASHWRSARVARACYAAGSSIASTFECRRLHCHNCPRSPTRCRRRRGRPPGRLRRAAVASCGTARTRRRARSTATAGPPAPGGTCACMRAAWS
jgi:hypothetical protein